MTDLWVDAKHPSNQLVLQYLQQKRGQTQFFALPAELSDSYYSLGCHPDIVQRLWDELNKNLPSDCRCLIYGTPALAHPHSGIIFAIGNGTQYNLQLTTECLQEAKAQTLPTRTRWSDGSEMDALITLGTTWRFGAWLKEEAEWCTKIIQS